LTDLVSVRDMFDRLFDERFFRPIGLADGERELKPALDVFTTAENVVAKVALPGVKPDDVEITISDDLVTVSGSFTEEHETEEKGYLHRDLSRGAFHRSFTLPAAVKSDDAKAIFKDGVLTLTIPRTEEIKPRHVKVETS
jgi:HSP20 family protein